jgi:hypothetical protein
MDIWMIYRIFKNPEINTKIDRIESVEYCTSEVDARKYSKLFDLQIPVDLRDKVSHKFYSSHVVDQ